MHDSAHEKHFDPQDMRYMGGLKKLLPITSITFIIGWLAISGIFPFAGFFSKDEILGAAFASGGILGYTLWVVGLMAAIMTAFYMTRQVKMVFFGKPRYGDDVINKPHESPKTMTIPLIVLSIFAVVAGFLNFPVHPKVYSELTTDHPIDLCRYQVANCYMGRNGLINSGGESKGQTDLAEAVETAIVNKRAGGMGLISGRKAFQKPVNEGVSLLNAIQDVYLDKDVTIA